MRERTPPIEWGPVERVATGAAVGAAAGAVAMILASLGRSLLWLTMIAFVVYVTATSIATVRYERRRRAFRRDGVVGGVVRRG